MEKKTATAVLLVVLLVVAMASTAFAGTQQLYSHVQIQYELADNSNDFSNGSSADAGYGQCGASVKQGSEAVQDHEVTVSENNEPVITETEEPAISENDGPVITETQEPETNGQPAEDEQNNTDPVEQSDQSLPGLSAQESEMVQYVNDERVKAGLKPLQVDVELAEVARAKSQDMVDNGYFDHNSPTYGSPFDMMKDFGIQYRAAGENIAKNGSVAGAHQSLMNSEGHRANILNPNFTHIGIGIVNSGNMVTITQMFIAK